MNINFLAVSQICMMIIMLLSFWLHNQNEKIIYHNLEALTDIYAKWKREVIVLREEAEYYKGLFTKSQEHFDELQKQFSELADSKKNSNC